MKPHRECEDYLQDIVDAAAKARSFVAGMDFQQFADDDKTSFAVIRALEIIGEATKRVPEPEKSQPAKSTAMSSLSRTHFATI